MAQRMRFTVVILALLTTSVSAQTVSTLTAAFNGSGGVSIDANGDIYVADFGPTLSSATGNTISRVTRDGTVTVFATGFQGASGNAFDSQGNLFQSNISGGFISKVTPEGQVSTFASANIVGPVGVAIDKDDNLYVANCGNASIAKVTPAGSSSLFLQSSLLNCPNGLTIDDNGNLYTCNFSNGNVIKITPNAVPSILATLPGGNNGHLTFANGVLYVVDRGGNRIWTVTLEGERTLLAGSGVCGKADGPALQASFSFPNGIKASPDGDTLYVNDAVPLCNVNLNPVVVRMITGVRGGLTDVSVADSKPRDFFLEQNYPNPFNPTTEIRYRLAQQGRVELTIYTLLGKSVRTLVDAVHPPGTHSVEWDGRNGDGHTLPSGLYLYRLKSDREVMTRRMLLLE